MISNPINMLEKKNCKTQTPQHIQKVLKSPIDQKLEPMVKENLISYHPIRLACGLEIQSRP